MTTQPLFTTDPSKFTDFAKVSAGDIFNQAILPGVTSLFGLTLPGWMRQLRRESQLQQDVSHELFQNQQDDSFLAEVGRNSSAAQPQEDPLSPGPVNYNAPLPDSRTPTGPAVGGDFVKTKIKLSNYGYDSDSSPDYNSNVLKIGHANNKLKDGLSAALTKSLAKRHGLKTGDLFEVVDSNGKIYKRRYDDTVPTTYKGKKLPETVDLYEVNGSNKFGGTIVAIRPLNSKPKSVDLPSGDGNLTDALLPPRN